jgi:beta-lactamase regulating signal transducer with metallopeptidase domain
MAAIGFLGLRLWWLISQHRGVAARAPMELKLHYWIIVFIGVITIAHPLVPRSEIFNPAAKVWSAQSIRSFPSQYTAPERGGYLMVSTPSGDFGIHTDTVSLALAIGALVVTLIGLIRFWRDVYSLQQIRRRSFRVRKFGSINIFLNEDIKVPYSSWMPGRTDVVIPSALLANFQDFKMAVIHELEHHRQGDTKWVYVMWGFKAFCAANPFVYMWNRWISELQEFAFDETLVDQNKVESRQYARCLVEVAETANNQKHFPACAAGLVLLVERNLLKRRIDRMINVNTNKRGRSITMAFGVALVALMAGVAYASSGFVQDRRVSMADAQRLALKAQGSADFPVVVNDLVLKQLNRYIGTPEGREFMRNALQRMKSYQSVIEGKINGYRVPAELIAVPITESGYKNLTEGESNTHMKAAGLWQFIPSSARNYGLRVDAQRDERIDVSLSTDAALRYLQSNRLRFNDWHLSILAYNMGEGAVQKGINETGSKDAWTLIRNGYEGDKDYLPKMMAAILIMKNPQSVE